MKKLKKLIKKKADYLDLLGSIDGIPIMLKDLSRNRLNPDARSFCVRHDVDYSLDKALMMGDFESKNGIFSTYFILHTAGYFDYSKEFGDKIVKLSDMGHDIGLHNDAITVWRDTKRDIPEIIREPLDFLRGLGIEIAGTSTHGNRRCYNEKYFNYEIWEEFDPTKNHGLFEGVPPVKYSLEKFNLEYEAYFLDYQAYLSDSGGNWIGLEITPDRAKLFERNGLFFKDNIGIEIIDKFNMHESGVLQCLFHPDWWELLDE